MHDTDADELIEQVALELRRPADLGTEVDDAVMAAIRSAPLHLSPPTRRAASGTPRRAWSWLVQPRTLRVSPIAGLAAAAAVAMLVVGTRRAAPDAGGETIAGASAPATATPESVRHDTVHVTHFMLVAPGARTVSVVGDFNDWDGAATPLRLASDSGVWSVELPLAPGRYHYTFLVDGVRWVADPVAPRAVDSDYGTPNSVVTVRGTDT